jgi:hypothetical protein
MTTQIYLDSARRPDLFHFNGPISPAQLDVWCRSRNLNVPNDLKILWCETGGGEMFETETLLSPFRVSEILDDVDSVNVFHKQRGMPSDYLIFHTGTAGLSVVKMSLGEYATVEEGVIRSSGTS